MYTSLTDAQWALLAHLFVEPEKRGRGKPHASWRTVLNSILFVLLTGAKWSMLPKLPEFASKSASHRWYLTWDKNGFLEQVLQTLKNFETVSSTLRFPPKRQRRPKMVSESFSIEQFATA